MPIKTNLDFQTIPCHACGSRRLRVIDSRPHDGAVYRRRRCRRCAALTTTIERAADNPTKGLESTARLSQKPQE